MEIRDYICFFRKHFHEVVQLKGSYDYKPMDIFYEDHYVDFNGKCTNSQWNLHNPTGLQGSQITQYSLSLGLFKREERYLEIQTWEIL